jgi:uncharacterized protein YggE
MRNKIMISVIGSLLLAGLVTLLGMYPATMRASAQEIQPSERTITVNGEGRVSLLSDVATISIGVQTENKQAAQAVTQNSSQATDVLSKLKQFGIDEKDIKTTNFSVYPRQQYDADGKPIETTYVVENTVNVKVTDVKKVGEIIDSVVKVGANNINSIRFDVSDPSSAYGQAIDAAMADAKAKAESVAKAASAKLGPVKSVQVSIGGRTDQPLYREAMAAPGAAQVPVAAGQTDVVVSVTVAYFIGG